jgi:hypothetical protein
MNERKLQLYQICNARAEAMASQTTSASAGRALSPIRNQAWGVVVKALKVRHSLLSCFAHPDMNQSVR